MLTLHRCPIDDDGSVFSVFSPEVHRKPFGLTGGEGEDVLLTPACHSVHLIFVGGFIVVGDQTHHCHIIGKRNDGTGATCCCSNMCLQGLQRGAEKTVSLKYMLVHVYVNVLGVN